MRNTKQIASTDEAGVTNLPKKDLNEILSERRISKAEFARMMNTSAQNIQNWCSRGVPSIKALEAASKLGVAVSDIADVKTEGYALDLDLSKIKSARDVMSTILELKLLKNLDQKELYKLIGMLDSLPSNPSDKE